MEKIKAWRSRHKKGILIVAHSELLLFIVVAASEAYRQPALIFMFVILVVAGISFLPTGKVCNIKKLNQYKKDENIDSHKGE